MMFWAMKSFPDSNSPSMENMSEFHLHTMSIIVMLMTFMLMIIYYTKKNNIMFFNLSENQTTELIWTTVPMILLMIIATPSIRLLYLMEEMFSPQLTIKVIGHQWYWSYEYSDFNLKFESFMEQTNTLNSFRLLDTDSSLVLPMNTTTRMLTTSMDVIHSWTIPTLGVKTDAIPGRLNQLNIFSSRSGSYFGQCSEICGANHSFMPISLNVSSMMFFKNWLKTLMKNM